MNSIKENTNFDKKKYFFLLKESNIELDLDLSH